MKNAIVIFCLMWAGCSSYNYSRTDPTTGEVTTFTARSMAYDRAFKSATWNSDGLSIKGATAGGNVEQITDLLGEVNRLKSP